MSDLARSINPANEETIETFADLSNGELEQRIDAAQKAFRAWRHVPLVERSESLRKMGATLRRQVGTISKAITLEMGKTLGEAEAEVLKCAGQCDWYAEHGAAMLADKPAQVESGSAHISYLPLGVILGVMPWNFPLWQAMRAAVPIMLAGNAFLLKPARNVLRSAFNLEEAWRESGLPEGLFSTLNIPQEKVAGVVADRRVAGVTVTAGLRAGAAVAAQAGALIKKSVLELGGADAFIVLRDADIGRAVASAVKARFQNNGQVCIAAKRFILEKAIAEEFTGRFVAEVRALNIGDPIDRATRLGPMARGDLRDSLHKQIKASEAAGARLLLGGNQVGSKGYFYQATVLDNVAPGMPVFDEETFGPCAALTVVENLDEAVALANRSDYGLSSNLWTEDLERANKVARLLEAGGVFINGFSASDPRVPIGGVKLSGYGRELHSFGVTEFTNVQTVWRDRA